MTSIRSAVSFISAGFVAFGLFACASAGGSATESAGDEATTSEEALTTCASVRCMAGTHCVMKKHRAACVADTAASECTKDSDCRVEADYCTGCNCVALAPTESVAACSGPGVRCFADPCMTKTAKCSSGQCIAQ